MREKSKGFTRRNFLKGSAATAAMVGAGKMLPMMENGSPVRIANAAPVEEKVYYGSCRANCFSGCRIKIVVSGGRVVRTEMGEFPEERYNRICAKGLTHTHRIYDPERLKYPMRRVGERGSGQWERISWKTAIDTIASTWKNSREKYGKYSIAFSRGTGNFSNSTLWRGNFFPSALEAVSIDCAYDLAELYTLPLALGSSANYGANEAADFANAKTIIVWGANTTEAQPQNYHFMRDSQVNGGKIICIDPNYTTMASKSDIHVPIKPATDAALALAMINIVIKEGWADIPFLKKSSVAPFLVKASDGKYLRLSDIGKATAGSKEDAILVYDGKKADIPQKISDPVIHGTFTINGIKVTTAYDLLIERVSGWTPEKVSKLCEVSVDKIYEITRLYAKNKPSSIYGGFGPDHFMNGHYFYFAMASLAIVTGNLGKPGASAGYHRPMGFNMNLPALTGASLPTKALSMPLVKFPQVVREKKYGDKDVNIRCLYNYCHNPLSNAAGRLELIETFKKMDLIVAADMRMTDTTKYADIILPVAHWFEYDDLHGTISGNNYTILQEKAVEPAFESRTDWDIFRDIAKAMGLQQPEFNQTHDDLLKVALTGDGPKKYGFSYDVMKKEKIKRSFGTREMTNGDFIHGADGTFPTPTGRAQFYLEDPKPNYNFGQKIDRKKESLPNWDPPTVPWETNPDMKKYPLIYSSERSKLKTHTQHGHVSWLLEIFKEPFVKISRKDADDRDIKTGDYVKIFNNLGYVVMKAVVNDGTRPGAVVVNKGWEEDQFVDGHYSNLTSTISHNFVLNNCFFEAICQVEKVKGGVK